MTDKNLKFHFSGICGAGMGNVATLMHQAGYQIKGSDSSYFPPMSEQLESLNIPIYKEYKTDNICADFTPDFHVISNVLSKNHEEVTEGKKKEIDYLSFPEVLNKFILSSRTNIVIAGTHGKTTTASLLSRCLKSLNPGYFIGGVMKDNQPGCRLGDPKAPFIIEGDEYDTAYFDKHSKFLHYQPKHLILTHLEWDHVDIFPNFECMVKEFKSLLKLIPEDGSVVYCGDLEIFRNLLKKYTFKKISYGFADSNDVQIKGSKRLNGKTHLRIAHQDSEYVLETDLFGDIYYSNLTASWAMAMNLGMVHNQIIENLGTFCGAKRRLERVSSIPFPIFSDFAHHPTAIEATINILLKEFPEKRIWAIFDPRNATSRRNIFEKKIISALNLAHKVSIGPVIEDKKIHTDEKFNNKSVAEQIGAKAKAYSSAIELEKDIFAENDENIVMLVMSCGAFYGILSKLQNRKII